jgi:hypothetical protein
MHPLNATHGRPHTPISSIALFLYHPLLYPSIHAPVCAPLPDGKYEVRATLRNTGHKHAVQRVQWHRSGQAALSASLDCVCLWDTNDAGGGGEWKKVRTLALPPDSITRAASQVMQVLYMARETAQACLVLSIAH